MNVLAWYSSILRPSTVLHRDLTVVQNAGARFIANMPFVRAITYEALRIICAEYKAQLFVSFSKLVVGWLSHVHRHPDTPIYMFLSRDTYSWLEAKRLQGRRIGPSLSKLQSWSFLKSLGVSRDLPTVGVESTLP